jgi:MoxR-like ATPase
VDGDSRYSEQKLTGWFDPPAVIRSGYGSEAFLPGPLVEAMWTGGVLLVNELNRLPEGVQNVLLPAIDERLVHVPRMGEVRAKESFRVVATQNPQDFVATAHLSEALLDRFELVTLGYQEEAEERAIVRGELARVRTPEAYHETLVEAAVRLARATRDHPRIRRGASVRAAIAIAEIAAALVEGGADPADALQDAAALALPTRVELERDFGADDPAGADAELLGALAREAVLGTPNPKKASGARPS